MNSYVEIDRLFGTPLNQIAKPKVPFKIKTWHWVLGLGVITLAAYGAYTVCNDVKSKFTKKDDDETSSKFNFRKSSSGYSQNGSPYEETTSEPKSKILKVKPGRS
ncbi:MAG: hypothetical protein ACXVPU_12285 [Bacteroidia bacterium]